MKRIALKIDVDTLAGTRHGVPALLQLLDRHQAGASFFFSLGPDRAGSQPRITSLKSYYPWRTRLYGRLLPSPDIGKRCRDQLRQVQATGFEIGIHAWDRVAWEEGVERADPAWVEAAVQRAISRFSEIFSEPAKAIAAAGWKSHRHALRLTQRLGLSYASDCRGSHPFIPVIDGEIVCCPQLPTTLPTLDEILALEPALAPAEAAERILRLSRAIPGEHVFTLRAELEGQPFLAAFEALLAGWKDAGITLVALRELRADLDIGALPRHVIAPGEIPGRPGLRMTQGEAFPLAAER